MAWKANLNTVFYLFIQFPLAPVEILRAEFGLVFPFSPSFQS